MPKPILLVDDPQGGLTELAQVLAANGYVAMLLPASGVAVEHFATVKPELVFVGLGLPEPMVICEGIRSDPDGAIVPVVLVGKDHPEVRSPADALNQGADYFFELPLDYTKVLAKVSTYIGPGEASAHEVIELAIGAPTGSATLSDGGPAPMPPPALAPALTPTPVPPPLPTLAPPPLTPTAVAPPAPSPLGNPPPTASAPTPPPVGLPPPFLTDDWRPLAAAPPAAAPSALATSADALLAVIEAQEAALTGNPMDAAANRDAAATADARREIEARLRAEQTARHEAEAQRAAEESWRRENEARQKAQDAARQAEEQARLQAEVARRAEQEAWRRTEQELQHHAEEEAARRQAHDEMRRRLEDEIRRKLEDENRQKLEDEARRRSEQELRRRVEEETRQRLEDETRRKLEDEARRRAQSLVTQEAEVRRQLEQELRREMGLPAAPSRELSAHAASPSLGAGSNVSPPASPGAGLGTSQGPHGTPMTPAAAGLTAPAVREGALEVGRDIATVLFSFVAQQVTGRVDFASQNRQKSVLFERGIPVDAYSSQPYDRIEEYLLREGRITRAQYQEARAKALRGPRRVAAYLASEGYLKPDELFVAVRGHLQETLYGLFEWEDGDYHYTAERAADEDKIALDADPRAVIVEGVRRKYLLPRLMARVGGPSSIVACQAPAGELEPLRLTSEERRTVRLLDGTRTIEDVIFGSGLEALRVYHLVVALCALGLAEVTVRGIEGMARDGASGADAIDRSRIGDKLEQVRDADYFQILGVARTATTFEIDRAFERVQGEFQPAHFSSKIQEDMRNELAEIEEVLAEARIVLREELLRSRYAQHAPA